MTRPHQYSQKWPYGWWILQGIAFGLTVWAIILIEISKVML